MGRRRASFAPSEDAITAAVLEHWRVFGLPDSLVFSIPNKRAHGQAGLTPGVADLGVLSPQLGAVTAYLELKRDHAARVSPAQVAFHQLLDRLHIPRFIVRGRDEPIDVLRSVGAVR